MYLKSISMQGFKSFAKKVNLDLSTPVTGVVGPNGSGKSNVAEAIRFVLGEQSMKGLRSKSGSDLIFKGSSHLSPLSRASVSMHLDNRNKKINEKFINGSHEISNTLSNFINLDEIILTREIYMDGASEYLINGTKVRLKDVQELLAMANISVAGHTIVNQGEADRILLSNSNDRREMIEDALGLRIYHIRIKEGEKKLDKVKTHLNEIELIRKENIPHLNYLKKQVKELEKREEEIFFLSNMLKVYLYKENLDIEKKKKEIHNDGIENRITTLESSLHILLETKKSEEENNDKEKENTLKNKLEEEISSLFQKINSSNIERENIYKEILNLDAEIRFLIKKNIENQNRKLEEEAREKVEKYFINKNEFHNFESSRTNLWKEIFNLSNAQKFGELPNFLKKANIEELDFFTKIKNLNPNEKNNFNNKEEKKYEIEIENLNKNKEEKNSLLQNLDKEIKELNSNKNKLEEELNNLKIEAKEKSFKLDNEILQAKLNLEKLYSQKETIKMKEENLRNQEENFEHITKDMIVVLGINTFKYRSFIETEMTELEKSFFNMLQSDLLRKIDRSKIKVEETGVTNAGDVLEEYKTLSERDEFLAHEISDLENSRGNLENLITDLKNTLLLDFNAGLEKINSNFNTYFSEIFTGGHASLTLEKVIKNKEENNGEEEEEKEPGIEISVNLPQKKVKDLQMLSGGERALSSIALIFAMSSINHPPFMVLDETDAALDEANARKYGKMVRRLSENSKLLVITHNRETMNQCDVLYGVTIGVEGSSKLLSIKFDEATEYAK